MKASKELLTIDTGPYSKDGPFRDPIVRCDACQSIVKLEVLHRNGCCPCGNTRVRNLQSLTGDEMEKCKKWEVDPDFLALFAPIDEETGEPLDG